MKRSLAIAAAVALTASAAQAQVLIYDNSPRIIKVPQAGAYNAAPTVLSDEDDLVEPGLQKIEVAPPRRKTSKPAPRPRRELSASSAPKRNVLSAPPPATELTPIRPTPRWRNNDPPPPIDPGSLPPTEIESTPQ